MPIQAPQWTEFLSCPVCCHQFAVKLRPPISLGCGHTICKTCLANLHRKQCPFDQAAIITDLDNLPINNALLQLVSNNNVTQKEQTSSNATETCLSSNTHASSLEIENSSSSAAGAAVSGTEPLSGSVKKLTADQLECYNISKKCIEDLALYLKPFNNGNITSLLSRPMQRKLVTLINCQLVEAEGRSRALRAARSLGERTVTELILQHQNPQQLSANLWAAVRARGCQFLGPAMQEEVLKLVLLALEDGSALSRKVLVMFVVQRLEPHFPQASKTSIGHVVQLLYRASCFKVSKREGDSSLMQLKEEFRTYDALRREHDAQIVQIATEAGLRIAPDQWSALLYGDTGHKSHMQSIIDKLQTPQSFAQSVQELVIALQRTNDPANLAGLRAHLKQLTNIDPTAENDSWQELAASLEAVKQVVIGLVEFVQHHGNRKMQDNSYVAHNGKYKISMCRDLAMRAICPRGASCTFAHSEEELEKYRAKNRKLHAKTPIIASTNHLSADPGDYLTDHSHNNNYTYMSSSNEDVSPQRHNNTEKLPRPAMISGVLVQQPQFEHGMYKKSPVSMVQGPNITVSAISMGKPSMNSLQPSTSFETKTQRRSFNAQQSQNYSISPMNIPPPPPPLPSIQSHMYAGSNQDNRSHLDSMNPRHQQKYQPKIPIMYSSPTNYPQPHASGKFTMNEAYNKPYIKAGMSPLMKSPQHPSQQQTQKYHMDNSNCVNNKIDLKSKYQPKMQFTTSSNNNYQFSESSMYDIRMLQSLEIRRQEIIAKLKQYDNPSFKQSTQQAVNGNNNAYHISNQAAPTTNDQSKNNNSSNTINNNEINVPPPSNPQIKNDLMNNYWNNTIAGNEFGYQSSLQQPQPNNSSRSPVELSYATPPILCDSQTQKTNPDSHSRDIFVRSDSILTDDDYVPFDAPAQSKFGPISRMSAKTSPYSTGLSADNFTAPNTTTVTSTSSEPSVWLYNNLQKSSNQYNYQSNELDPMLNENMARDGYGPNNSNEDEQNILTMELKFIEQKLMRSSNIAMTDLNKFASSQNSIDQFLWSPSNAVPSPSNQSNYLLMKSEFWNNSKQQASGHKAAMLSIGRNAKSVQPIVDYNQSVCEETTNESSDLNIKIKEVHSPHCDRKEANISSSSCGGGKSSNSSSGNTNNVNIMHLPAPKFGCDDTYEDGIDKDMRDLERRLESELEEHEKLWSPEEETPISQT
ncbi:roquin-1 isoform X2 [Sitodiplosis mosellana]|uniref:roquin-1 isoform X2 n=1 Tax=Sitodiplosis mosellana TaxID=263140 RepID=UPI0024443051|nr:roquin-1 isoform X2 [Sitodiplosis mosellana]XP_055315611.1 roquin-1 isoform X2 [Sitodiplosis mosellana]